MLKITGYILLYLSNISALPAIWIGKSNRSILWYYVLACFLSDALGYLLKWLHLGHSLVSNLFLLIEFITISTYYKNVFLRNKYNFHFIAVISIAGLFYSYCTYTNWMNAKTDAQALNYVGASVFYVAYIILSIKSLYKVMKEVEEIRIERSPLFLASTAFLLYSAGALFPFIFKNVAIETSYSQFSKIWGYFFLPLNIIKNILLAFSLHRVLIAKNR